MARNVRAPQGMTDTLTAQWGVLFTLSVRFVIYHVRGRVIFTPTFVLSLLLLSSFS